MARKVLLALALASSPATAFKPVRAGLLAAYASTQVRADDEPVCRPFTDIYANGQELIEVMWNNAFTYEPDESRGYTQWFFDDSKKYMTHFRGRFQNQSPLAQFRKRTP